MEEKKAIKVSLSTLFLIIAIIIIVAMACYIYLERSKFNDEVAKLQENVTNMENMVNSQEEKIKSISNTINSDNSSVKNNNINSTDNSNIEDNNVDELTNIYNECEKRIEGVVYRRDDGGSSGFLIKNGILYSGEQRASGITGSVKYVVPINKQIHKSIALTENGKLYINKEEDFLYGNTFESFLPNYNILEILQIPDEKEYKFLCSNGKIINMDGTIYKNLI